MAVPAPKQSNVRFPIPQQYENYSISKDRMKEILYIYMYAYRARKLPEQANLRRSQQYHCFNLFIYSEAKTEQKTMV